MRVEVALVGVDGAATCICNTVRRVKGIVTVVVITKWRVCPAEVRWKNVPSFRLDLAQIPSLSWIRSRAPRNNENRENVVAHPPKCTIKWLCKIVMTDVAAARSDRWLRVVTAGVIVPIVVARDVRDVGMSS